MLLGHLSNFSFYLNQMKVKRNQVIIGLIGYIGGIISRVYIYIFSRCGKLSSMFEARGEGPNTLGMCCQNSYFL